MTRNQVAWIVLGVILALLVGLAFVLTVQQETDRRSNPAPRTPGAPGSLEELSPDVRWDQYQAADTSADMALLYFALVGQEPTEEEYSRIAFADSESYRALAPGFARSDYLQEVLKPRLQERMQQFKGRHFVLSQDVYLADYDPDIQAFPLTASMAMPARARWRLEDSERGTLAFRAIKVQATNQDRFAQVMVKDESTARSLDALDRRERQCTAKIYLYAERVREEPFGPIIQARIVSMQIFGRSSRLIATLG